MERGTGIDRNQEPQATPESPEDGGGAAMTVKQLAQRLGTTVPRLDFAFYDTCAACDETGGPLKKCCEGPCAVQVAVEIKEADDDKRS
jgi:hypothetical protein